MSIFDYGMQMVHQLGLMDHMHTPPGPEEVESITRALSILRTDHRQRTTQITLQKRILEGLRIHETVGYNASMQRVLASLGGYTTLIDLLLAEWPDDSDFAASTSSTDAVVRLPWSLDPELLESCAGSAFMAFSAPQPLRRSLRRVALGALAEMSNYPESVLAIWQDGRIFRADWFPQKLTECMRRYKYGWTTLQQQKHPDQGQDIAERLLYLAGNCCCHRDINAFLNDHCGVPVVRTFRDNWQRRFEPVAGEPDPAQAALNQRLQQEEHERMGNHLPASPEEMMEMVQQSQLATGGADIMNYTFLRYMTHTVPTATDSQIKELINAGGITKVRVVDTNTVQAHRSGVSVGIVLSRLMPVYQEQVLTRSRRAIQAKAAEKLLLLSHGAHPDLAKAEEFRLQGNACFKQGQLMAALQAWSKGVHLEPSSTLLYNNLSLAFLKMGRNDECHEAAVSGVSRDPTNAKAWVRLGEGFRAVGRWQLSQLAYSVALDVLHLKDAAVEEWRLQTCDNLARVWQFDELPVPWLPMDNMLSWLKLPPKPLQDSQLAAWSRRTEQEVERLKYSSRSLCVQLKVYTMMIKAWREAESGKLKSLPKSKASLRVTWKQLPLRGAYCKRARYEMFALMDDRRALVELVVDGEPRSKDVLLFVATLCFNALPKAARPETLLLDYRVLTLYAELHHTLVEKWGLDVQLETELEARRRAKLCHEHYLGLCPELAAAGPGAANEAVLPVILPQKLPSTDPNSDHKSSPRNRGTAHATSSGNASSKPTGSNGAGQSAGRSSSNTPAAAAAAKGKHQAQPLCMSGPGSCSSSSRPGHSGTAGTASGASPELDGGTKVTHFHLNELCRHNSSPGWKLSMDRMRYGRTVASDLSALR